jgi:hypothetical protein
MSNDEVQLKLLAEQKSQYCSLIYDLQNHFRYMRDQGYPDPHTVNVRSHAFSQAHERIAGMILESDARSGLETIWVEDWPLFERYFQLCFEKENALALINYYQREYKRVVLAGAQKSPKRKAGY